MSNQTWNHCQQSEENTRAANRTKYDLAGIQYTDKFISWRFVMVDLHELCPMSR